MSAGVTIVAVLAAREGRAVELEALLADLAIASRVGPGNQGGR